MAQDRAAAMEMMRLTRQNGVPVIADAQEAIVGFDLPRLQRMAQRHKGGAGLGLKVKDATDGPGALVGAVKPGSRAERAGIAPGDVVVELTGRPVNSVADLERVMAQGAPGQPTSIMLRRGEERRTLILPA